MSFAQDLIIGILVGGVLIAFIAVQIFFNRSKKMERKEAAQDKMNSDLNANIDR